ncbi:MAG TPA: IscS subfamily cysteine desulfurase [Steroidobacteraceae bacterium]|nr:IscS subfamily cysteine desulfurase [Steroidobacteraceae bacterium]
MRDSAQRPVYMDYAATTPVDARVAAAMAECLVLEGSFGNASSTGHSFGAEARRRVESARAEVAQLIGAEPAEIVWTSGATESNNLAILGAARFRRDRGLHVITSKTEHKAVLDPCRQLEKEGFRVTYLRPDRCGIIAPEQLAEALRADTVLVSIMHVNNEVGVIQHIEAIGRLCRERGVLLHVDAAQSVGKIPVDVRALGVDLLSLTAHKLYGPKGSGALFMRRRPPIGLAPLMFGGGQEGGVRSGTLATHQIVGLGTACAIAREEMASDAARIEVLRARLLAGLESLGDVHLNGHPTQRIAHLLNVSFEGVEGESLIFGLPGLAVSTGSACNSATQEPSYVLRALGRSDALAQGSVRFSFGKFSSSADVDEAVRAVGAQIHRLRALSPAAEL